MTWVWVPAKPKTAGKEYRNMPNSITQKRMPLILLAEFITGNMGASSELEVQKG